jgi:general secretion pathway protein B
MSYILDALKKAESERRLGSVPDMHAPPVAIASAAGSPVWGKPFAWSALAAVLLAATVIAWLAPWQTSRRSDSGTPSQQPAPSIAAAPASRDASSTPPPDKLPAEPAKTTQQAVPADPVKPKAKPRPVKQKKSEPAPAAAKTAKTENAATAAASIPEARLPGLRQLPENIQRELPALTVGGYIYSNVPSERSILINNRLLHEGSEIAPGLTLEQMLPKEAVLSYKGYRYRIPY